MSPCPRSSFLSPLPPHPSRVSTLGSPLSTLRAIPHFFPCHEPSATSYLGSRLSSLGSTGHSAFRIPHSTLRSALPSTKRPGPLCYTCAELCRASPRRWPSGGLNGGHGRHIKEPLTTRLTASVPQLLYESPTRELAVFHYVGEGPTPTRGAWQRCETYRPPASGPIRRSSALKR